MLSEQHGKGWWLSFMEFPVTNRSPERKYSHNFCFIFQNYYKPGKLKLKLHDFPRTQEADQCVWGRCCVESSVNNECHPYQKYINMMKVTVNAPVTGILGNGLIKKDYPTFMYFWFLINKDSAVNRKIRFNSSVDPLIEIEVNHPTPTINYSKIHTIDSWNIWFSHFAIKPTISRS